MSRSLLTPRLFVLVMMAALGIPGVAGAQVTPKQISKKKPTEIAAPEAATPKSVQAAPPAASTPLPVPAKASERYTALVYRVVLKVVHPEAVREKLIAEVDAQGGFPSLITDEQLVLRVPPAALTAAVEGVVKQGLVLEKTLEREDLTQTIANLEGQVASRLEIQERLRSFFDGSDTAATLRIEQSLTELIVELEGLKGALRVAKDRARFAVVDVSFQFLRPDRIVYVNSPFEWLNSVDLDRFLGEF